HIFFFSSRRRHTRCLSDWSSDVCSSDLEILVAYCSLQGAEPGFDPEFGVEIQWDVPLLDGYKWVHVPNRSLRPRLAHFWGLWNQIGRASCRERVEMSVVGGGVRREIGTT